jgi:predicted lipoprotein
MSPKRRKLVGLKAGPESSDWARRPRAMALAEPMDQIAESICARWRYPPGAVFLSLRLIPSPN